MRRLTLHAFALLIPICAAVGCVQRTIHIDSDPSGALVYLNDEEVGRTPVDVPFMWYGTYDVRLEKDGYEPLWTTGEADAPWWEYPGPDLIAEAIPGARSDVYWEYDLERSTPADEVDVVELNDRARMLRRETREFERE